MQPSTEHAMLVFEAPSEALQNAMQNTECAWHPSMQNTQHLGQIWQGECSHHAKYDHSTALYLIARGNAEAEANAVAGPRGAAPGLVGERHLPP